jgi:hypothetical protein
VFVLSYFGRGPNVIPCAMMFLEHLKSDFFVNFRVLKFKCAIFYDLFDVSMMVFILNLKDIFFCVKFSIQMKIYVL